MKERDLKYNLSLLYHINPLYYIHSPLTQDEINHIAALYIEEVQKSHPEWNTKVDVKETQ